MTSPPATATAATSMAAKSTVTEVSTKTSTVTSAQPKQPTAPAAGTLSSIATVAVTGTQPNMLTTTATAALTSTAVGAATTTQANLLTTTAISPVTSTVAENKAPSWRTLVVNEKVACEKSRRAKESQTLVSDFIASQGGDQLKILDDQLAGNFDCKVFRETGRNAGGFVTLKPWWSEKVLYNPENPDKPIVQYIVRPCYWNTPITKDGVLVQSLVQVREIINHFLYFNCKSMYVQQEILNAYYRANSNARRNQNVKPVPVRYGFDELLDMTPPEKQ